MKTLLLIVAMLIAGCQSISPTPDAGSTLYQQLGERSGIADIVEDMLYRTIEDSRINQHFRGVDIADLHTHLTDQLCALAGGPCTYTGRSMRESHADMDISDTEFNALTEQLVLAMDDNGVPTGAQNRLIAKLVPMYPDIRNL